jgi:hypothetical protein
MDMQELEEALEILMTNLPVRDTYAIYRELVRR